METLGINWGYLIFQLLVFGIYPVLSLIALFALRRSRITGLNQVLWALLIAAIPVLGALAFFIINPTENTQS
ncbi:MAG TPA: PLDc N-terminal domain-containing protein [Anaerolineales bacterium]|nr:PLDc N-terminal domain-containing protein [Anaerolineales bacterium]